MPLKSHTVQLACDNRNGRTIQASNLSFQKPERSPVAPGKVARFDTNFYEIGNTDHVLQFYWHQLKNPNLENKCFL